MPKVRKLNKTLTVDSKAVESYLKQGYDQIDDSGKVIKKATGGKAVSASEYNQAVDQVEEYRLENAKLAEENKNLKAELAKVNKDDKDKK